MPLSAVARVNRGIAPLVVNHQGQFPATTITYNIAPDVPLEDGHRRRSNRRWPICTFPTPFTPILPATLQAFQQTASAQPLLILAALIAVYIVLGVLYESLAHPLTIISTLPSAGLGALLALQILRTELTVIAFIGIILLIGIVKKNGIMMVDFALEGERQRGLSPAQAIHEACLARFRPIMMTTMAAMLGALPLVIASGPGSELRRPLGITIIGGLLVSQALTLYTTPVIYLLLDRLHRRLGGASFQSLIRRSPDRRAAAGRVTQTPRYRCCTSGRSGELARIPVHTTRPRSIRKCRSATRVSAPTFLSITRMARPDLLSRSRQRQISARISGARPFGRLVEDKQPRIGHQRAADRQHLLFAAGELVAHAGVALGKPRKQGIDRIERPLRAVARRPPSPEGSRAH